MNFKQSAGRILLGSLFLISAINSLFFGFNNFVNTVKSKNIPFPMFVALIVLIFKLIASILIISDYYENYIITSLIIFVTMTIFLYHNAFIDNEQLNNMMKNIAIIGGLILLYK